MRRLAVAYAAAAGLALVAGPRLADAEPPGGLPPASEERPAVEKRFEGRVTDFLPRRSLTIAMEDAKTRTFQLDERDVDTTVAPGVEVGSRVRVVDARNVTGRRTVTVTLASARRARR